MSQLRYIGKVVALLFCAAILAGCGRTDPEENVATPSKVLVMDEAGFDS